MTAATVPAVASRPSTWTVYLWELRKLRAQKRTYLGLAAVVLVPIAFVVALAVQHGAGPTDVPLGRAGLGFTALVPRTASLEELFLDLTEGEPQPVREVA